GLRRRRRSRGRLSPITGVKEYWPRSRPSLRLDAGKLHDLAPFLGFVGDELAEIGGRAGKRGSAQIGEPRLNFGIAEARIDLLVEPVDDICRRVLGRANTVPLARPVNPHHIRPRPP